MEDKLLKWYGHIARIEDNRRLKSITTWLPGGRLRQGRPEVKWGKEELRVINQRNLTSDEAQNHQLMQLKTSNR
jgi:hypothetical protein